MRAVPDDPARHSSKRRAGSDRRGPPQHLPDLPRMRAHLSYCKNRSIQEKFHCVTCGHSAHADTVAALNVLRAGLVRRDANPA
jgi:hypothetical protein